jgi:tol-pal system protein YbgF
MKPRVCALLVFLFVPLLSLAQKKEYVQLQRDVAILQDQLRTLQRTLDEKMAQLTLLVQQAIDTMNKTNASITALQGDLKSRLAEQEKTVVQPVASMGSRVDELSGSLQAIQESLSALTVRFGRLEQQMVDTSNAVKTLQAPPPPPGASGSGGTISAQSLYDNALRDKNAGNFDLAIKEFQDYLQSFGDTELAPNAQFYLGEIYYLKNQLEEAVKAFDLVIEKYPENLKTPDAHYMKGMALFKMGQRNKARDEFYTLIKRFPESTVAAKAKDTLRSLGLPANPPRTVKKKARSR